MDKNDFSTKAQAVMARAGQPDCTDWPEGTVSLGGSDRGAWGNLSIRSWWVPTPGTQEGTTISWDSDDREYSVSRYHIARPE